MEIREIAIKDAHGDWNETFLKYFSKEELYNLGTIKRNLFEQIYSPFRMPRVESLTPRQVELFWEISLIKNKINFYIDKKTKRITTHVDDAWDKGEIELNITIEQIKRMDVVAFREEHYYGNDSDRWSKLYYYISEKKSESEYITHKLEKKYFYFNAWAGGGGKCKDFEMNENSIQELKKIIEYLEKLNLKEYIHIEELEIRKTEFYNIELEKEKRKKREEQREEVREVEKLRDKISELLPSMTKQEVRRKINRIGYQSWQLEELIVALKIVSEYHNYEINKALDKKSIENVCKYLPDLRRMFERSVLFTEYCFLAVELVALNNKD